MGADCCGHSATFEGLSARSAGWTQALQADALDFLGDATTYGISLAVIGTSIQIRARAAILKALSLTVMALGVLALLRITFSFLAIAR